MKVSRLCHQVIFSYALIISSANTDRLINPVNKLLDPSCVTAIIYQTASSSDAMFMRNLLSRRHNQRAGFLLLSEDTLADPKALKRIRASWFCFDVIHLNKQPKFESVLLRLEVRNSRYFYMGNNNSTDQLLPFAEGSILTQPINFLDVKENGQGNTNLWVACPPLKRKGSPIITNIIDQFSTKKQKWIGKSHLERLSYKMCNPIGKNYYHGRDLVFTGVLSQGAAATPANLVKFMANKLGSNIKMKNTRGCLHIYKARPNGRTTLGQLYDAVADVGSSVTSSRRIGQQFDFAFYTYDAHFFMGPRPNVLPQHKNISYPFDNATWLLLFIALVCCTVSFVLIRAFSKDKPAHILDAIFLAFGTMFSENHFILFKDMRRPWKGTFLRTIWLVGTFLLSMAYQGTLLASLAKKSYEKAVETHEDMMNTDLPAYGVALYPKSPIKMRRDVSNYILEKNAQMKFTEIFQVLDRLLKGEKAYLFSTTFYQLEYENFFAKKYGMEKQFPLVRLKERFDLFSLTLTFMKYRPQTEILSTMLDYLISGGIPEHEFTKYDRYRGKKEITSVDEDSMKLKATHVMVVSFILISAQIWALLIFVFELTSKKRKSKSLSKVEDIKVNNKKKSSNNSYGKKKWVLFGSRSRIHSVMDDDDDEAESTPYLWGQNYLSIMQDKEDIVI